MDWILSVVNHPLFVYAAIAVLNSGLVSVARFIGSTDADGKTIRKRMPLGVFWLGKNQWLWGAVLPTAAWFTDQVPHDYPFLVTVGGLMIVTTGLHSMAKNAGHQSAIPWLVEKFSGKVDK